VIALIDYGAGNLTSVRKALSTLGAEFVTPRDPTEVTGRGIIVPGVGHFGATCALDGAWRQAVRDALDRGASLFGICLGMQWLFEGSDEAPDAPGLGLISGRCVRFDAAAAATQIAGPSMKIPHVGWNSLQFPKASTILMDVPADSQVYFTHSYLAPVVPESAAITTYLVPFSAAVETGRIAGVQFHPEKSADVGLRILKNWLDAL
jgi:glutamine amidotransferase